MVKNVREAKVSGELEIGEFGEEAINCLLCAGPEISCQCMPSVVAEVSMQILNDRAKADPATIAELLTVYEEAVNANLDGLAEHIHHDMNDQQAIGAALATVVASDLVEHLPNIVCIVALRMAAQLGYEEVPVDMLFRIHAITQFADDGMTLDELKNRIAELIIDDDTETADAVRISRMA